MGRGPGPVGEVRRAVPRRERRGGGAEPPARARVPGLVHVDDRARRERPAARGHVRQRRAARRDRPAPAGLAARPGDLRPHHRVRPGGDSDDVLQPRAVQGAPLVPPRLLARRLRGPRADRAVGLRAGGAPPRRATAGDAAAQRAAARHRRARVRGHGRGRHRARDQPARVLPDLAVGHPAADRPAGRRLAAGRRHRLRLDALGRRLAPRPAAVPRGPGDGAAARARPALPPGRHPPGGRRRTARLLCARRDRRRARPRARVRAGAGAEGGRVSAPAQQHGPAAAHVPEPAARPMTPGVRAGLVAIASVIFWLGLTLFVFPSDTATLFAWTIQPPLTAAFLGASYWASTTLAATCALERDWVRGRAFAAPYLIAGVILLVVTFVHLDKFHMDAVTGWAWLILYAVFPPAVIALLLRQVRTPGAEPPRDAPMPRALVAALALLGGALVLLGAALVVAPVDAAALWPWPLTPLTGRAIGTFVLAQGALALVVCREHYWGRVRPAMLQQLVVGVLQLVALARFSGTLDWDRAGAWLYLAAVLAILGTGALGVARGLRREAPAGRS